VHQQLSACSQYALDVHSQSGVYNTPTFNEISSKAKVSKKYSNYTAAVW